MKRMSTKRVRCVESVKPDNHRHHHQVGSSPFLGRTNPTLTTHCPVGTVKEQKSSIPPGTVDVFEDQIYSFSSTLIQTNSASGNTPIRLDTLVA